MDETYNRVEKDFKENGITSVCYLMRKFKITSIKASEYMKKLSNENDKSFDAPTSTCEGKPNSNLRLNYLSP